VFLATSKNLNWNNSKYRKSSSYTRIADLIIMNILKKVWAIGIAMLQSLESTYDLINLAKNQK
jgi:hypothetical protein